MITRFTRRVDLTKNRLILTFGLPCGALHVLLCQAW